MLYCPALKTSLIKFIKKMRGGNHLPKYLSDQINTVDLNMIDGACRGAFLDGAT
jgi:hypothetical protein